LNRVKDKQDSSITTHGTHWNIIVNYSCNESRTTKQL